MDGLDWSKFQQHEMEESLIIPSSNCNLYSNNRDNFNPVQQNQKIDPFPNLYPQWNANHSLNSPFQYNNPQIGPILNSGPTSPQRNILCGQVPADSLESIDCLLSASNLTDTTTSIEDDGISLIFSNCNNLWNNNSNHFAAVKSVRSLASLSENTDPGMETNNCGSAPQTSSHEIEIPIIINNGSQGKRKRGESQHNLDFHHQASEKDNIVHHRKPKRPMLEIQPNIASSNINFQQPSSSASSSADEPDPEAIAHMKEIIYRAAAFRPVDFGTEAVEKPKRKNVRISSDPQTVAARQRREKISEKIRVLQRLVPGGSKMDTASMLDEAANYLKFLRAQIKALEGLGQKIDPTVAFASPFLMNYSFAMQQQQQQQPLFSIQSPNPVNQPKS